uniref:Uncharacterized protein n=1 Tax=viral metagenome TaxID=1070528 RepID=A0A2V0R9C1_9ZZZZ
MDKRVQSSVSGSKKVDAANESTRAQTRRESLSRGIINWNTTAEELLRMFHGPRIQPALGWNIVIHGLPGSGESTLLSTIQEEMGAIVQHSDPLYVACRMRNEVVKGDLPLGMTVGDYLCGCTDRCNEEENLNWWSVQPSRLEISFARDVCRSSYAFKFAHWLRGYKTNDLSLAWASNKVLNVHCWPAYDQYLKEVEDQTELKQYKPHSRARYHGLNAFRSSEFIPSNSAGLVRYMMHQDSLAATIKTLSSDYTPLDRQIDPWRIT